MRDYWLSQSQPSSLVTVNAKKVAVTAITVGLLSITHAALASESYAPVRWTKFVQVAGQSEPVPERWLQDEEARIAYSLKLPDSVPKQVPYVFAQPLWERLWFNAHQKASVRYFNHLCSTEAGEWIFKKVQNVEGFYFARPQGEPTSDLMADPYGPEMPWIQRLFMLRADTRHDQGAGFIQPPQHNYHFVEQPRRDVKWHAGITEPYIRLFGYTRERERDYRGVLVDSYSDKDPMQVIGIPKLTARYGYTWRGLKRAQDRENGIAGGELLIYDLQTKEVLAVRRQFLITMGNRRNGDKAAWEVATSCPQVRAEPYVGEISQFAFDVIQTIEPSRTGKK
jgi:hypothetical protein